jgi:hypothetical protein
VEVTGKFKINGSYLGGKGAKKEAEQVLDKLTLGTPRKENMWFKMEIGDYCNGQGNEGVRGP